MQRTANRVERPIIQAVVCVQCGKAFNKHMYPETCPFCHGMGTVNE